MKQIYTHKLFFLAGLFCLSLTSCDYANGEGEGSENAVYMETPGNKGVMPFVLEPEGGRISITPRLANITDNEVGIQIKYDESVLKTYNKLNSTNYEVLPSNAFKLSTEGQEPMEGGVQVKVNKGDFASKVDIIVGELNDTEFPNSKKYAIPLSITSATAFHLIPSQRSVLLILNRPLVTSVACFTGKNIQIKPTRVWDNPEWTIQMTANYSNLTRTNLPTAFISNWGGSEFYTRIEAKQGIQVKNGRDGEDTYTQVSLLARKWLQMTFVYKENSVTVYVNGKVHKVFPTAAIFFNDKSLLTIGTGAYSNDYVREVRLWSKALTEAEINDMLYMPISPDTPNLEVYVPLTSDTKIKDLKAPVGVNNVTEGGTGTITWLENVKFPADDLIIVPKE